MKSSKVNTQKITSTVLALVISIVTFSSASALAADQPVSKPAKSLEAKLIAEIEQMFFEEDQEMSLVDEIESEEFTFDVKVFGENDELLAEGNTVGNKSLQKFVNKAELIGEFGGKEYYRIVK